MIGGGDGDGANSEGGGGIGAGAGVRAGTHSSNNGAHDGTLNEASSSGGGIDSRKGVGGGGGGGGVCVDASSSGSADSSDNRDGASGDICESGNDVKAAISKKAAQIRRMKEVTYLKLKLSLTQAVSPSPPDSHPNFDH